MTSDNRSYGNRYAVLERVGAGGMAEVYRARDELLGRDVAVKVLSEHLSKDRSFVERFRREAQSAANLNHPNIVSLYDYGADDDTYFIVMEFIEGRSLAEVITAEGPLMPERATEIAADVAKALERAHATGLVHRDIKPSNIMVTPRGETKVTDFGIARALGGDAQATVTQTGMVIGTAAYLSPEQAQGHALDTRSDIYSLGCVLYEMLTGRGPFEGETPLAIAYKHVGENPAPPSTRNRDVRPELDAIVLKAMAKNPENRYYDAREMHDDLMRFLSGQRVRATPILEQETTVAAPVAGTRVLRPTESYEPASDRRKATVYVLSAVAVLVLFGILAWVLFNNLVAADQVRVPSVVGETVDVAQERLERRGLDDEIRRIPSRKPINQVVRQDPVGGDLIDKGGTVTLFVSDGPRQVEVPEVIGLQEDEAKDALRNEGLKIGEVIEEPSDVEEGEVIDHDPGPDETVDAGTAVNLVVSSGPEPATVPTVVGQTEDSAIEEIEREDLVAEVRREPNEAAEGTVFDQNPDGGTEVEPGSQVTIYVSEGPESRPMPDVRGDPADQAEQELEQDYGLNVTVLEETQPCSRNPGTVCRQQPAPNTPVQSGDNATLYVRPQGQGFLDDPLAMLAFFLGGPA